MGKDWPYSNFSHEAKEHGGPENYVKDIQKERDDFWIPIVEALAIPAIYGVVSGVKSIKNRIQKRQKLKAKAEYAEKELVENYHDPEE